MATDDYDPYAPPAEEDGGSDPEPGRRSSRGADYESERRPVVLMLLLTVVTCGFYPVIWLFRRREFLDTLDADAKLSPILPVFVGVSHLGLIVLATAMGAQGSTDLEPVARILQIATGVTMLMAVFRVASMLRSDFNRSGRFLTVSSAGTFFFGTFYLQYKINQAADTAPLKKRKKKKKLREAVKDASAETATEEPRA
jgi:hypothetical protein